MSRITGYAEKPMPPRAEMMVAHLDAFRREFGDAVEDAWFDYLGGLLRWGLDNAGPDAMRRSLLEALEVLDATVKLSNIEETSSAN